MIWMSPSMIPATRQKIKETPFAERRCQNYAALIKAFDQRRCELGFSQLELDARAGWADGYAGKLIAMNKNMGRLSFGLMVDALGLEIVVRSRCNGEQIAEPN
jgi:hypothetical protein